MSAPVLMCRVVTTTLWITGGSEGILYGGEELPGWLGQIAHIKAEDPEGCWLEVGGTRDWPELKKIEDVRLPDAVVPSEFLLQRFGRELFQQPVPWTLTNLKILPQFPGADVSVPSQREWQHPDGFSIQMRGLLSEKAPLRIPPSQLRPLWVTDPVEHVQQEWVQAPAAETVFQVVVLPEQSDVVRMSDQFPEARILVEHAGGRPQVIPLDEGRRFRVRPGSVGRALIRVDIRWDTVQKEFRNPLAEVIWLRSPNLESLPLPPAMANRTRPLQFDTTERQELMTSEEVPADVFFLTGAEAEMQTVDIRIVGRSPWWPPPEGEFGEVRFPDTQKLFLGPDQVLMRIPLSKSEVSKLRTLDLPSALGTGNTAQQSVLIVPAEWAAGNGGDGWMTLRRFLDGCEHPFSVWGTRWELLK